MTFVFWRENMGSVWNELIPFYSENYPNNLDVNIIIYYMLHIFTLFVKTVYETYVGDDADSYALSQQVSLACSLCQGNLLTPKFYYDRDSVRHAVNHIIQVRQNFGLILSLLVEVYG